MRRQNGFTLIELLIVIAIIGILAAVLIPNLLRARSVSYDRAAQAYAHNVYKTVQAYIAENPQVGILPGGTCTNGVSLGGYSVTPPSGSFPLVSCTYSDQAAQVTVTYTNGTSGSFVLGQ